MADGCGTDEGKDGLRDGSRGGQDAKLIPVGEALRSTFDADNHATLSQDVTKLMLDLARVPFEPHEFDYLAKDAGPVPVTARRTRWLVLARLILSRSRRY